jgi:hypothetical protein
MGWGACYSSTIQNGYFLSGPAPTVEPGTISTVGPERHGKLVSYENSKKKNTHKHHTTTNMSGGRTTLRRLCPPVTTTGRGDLAPKHCAAAPLQVGAGREPSGLRSPARVSLLGR